MPCRAERLSDVEGTEVEDAAARDGMAIGPGDGDHIAKSDAADILAAQRRVLEVRPLIDGTEPHRSLPAVGDLRLAPTCRYSLRSKFWNASSGVP